MIKQFKNLLNIPEYRSTILNTIFIIFVFRLGCNIPLPFINLKLYTDLYNSNSLFKVINLFSGGGLEKLSLFLFGLNPFLIATGIISILTLFIPYYRNLKESGVYGNDKLIQHTRYFSLIVSLLEAIPFIYCASKNNLIKCDYFEFVLLVITISTGSLFTMYLAETIDNKGIGSGKNLLISSGILVNLIPNLVSLIDRIFNNKYYFIILPLFLMLIFLLVSLIIFFNKSIRRIPTQYAKRPISRKIYGGQGTFIPIKLGIISTDSIFVTINCLSIPAFILSIFHKSEICIILYNNSFYFENNIFYLFIFIILLMFFSLIKIYQIYNPSELSDNLLKHGGFIPGIRPGKNTSYYIDHVLLRLIPMMFIYIIIITITPVIINSIFNLRINNLIGVTCITVITTFLDIEMYLESGLLMRHYDGFVKNNHIRGR